MRGRGGARTTLAPSTDSGGWHASTAQDLLSVALGVWLVAALFSDGWAHHNRPDLEGFFTPWHGALYSGLLANGLWIARLGRSGGLWGWWRALPVGYGWGAVGAAVFAAGGLADMVWHLTLGVEVGLDALLSPPHLVLLCGGMLILTSALRSRWAAGDTSSGAAQAALALATALAAFFLLYLSEFATVAPTVAYRRLPEAAPGHEAAELPAVSGLGAFLVTTLVLAVPLLLAWQRGPAPRSLVTVLVGTVAWLSVAVMDFQGEAVWGAAGASVGAVVADAAVRWLDRSPVARTRARLPVLAGVAVAAVWLGHVTAVALGPGLAWPTELWFGVVVLCALAAAVLGGLAAAARASLDAPREPVAASLC